MSNGKPGSNEKFPKLNLLYSHAHLRDRKNPELLGLCKRANVLIDSGAFTNMNRRLKALKTGEPAEAYITVDGYSKDCQAHYAGQVWDYITLDVIGDQKGTWKNYSKMRDKYGLAPMPVVHAQVEQEHLARYLEDRNRISVGGIAGNVATTHNFARHYYQKIYKMSNKTAKIHALGFLNWPDVFQLPLRYGDSSTFINGVRYGIVMAYDRRNGFSSLKRPQVYEADQSSYGYRKVIRQALKCNVTMDMLLDEKYWTRHCSIAGMITAFAYLQFFRHAKEQNFAIFFVVNVSHTLTCLVSTMATADNEKFDYVESRKIYAVLEEVWKRSRLDYVDMVNEILKDKTRYRQVLA